MHNVIKGIETIIMEDPEEYYIGQTISISPQTPLSVFDQHGNRIRISPKAGINGTVIDKRY
jgi:hypothetical protein